MDTLLLLFCFKVTASRVPFQALGWGELDDTALGFCPVELTDDGVSIHSFGGHWASAIETKIRSLKQGKPAFKILEGFCDVSRSPGHFF